MCLTNSSPGVTGFCTRTLTGIPNASPKGHAQNRRASLLRQPRKLQHPVQLVQVVPAIPLTGSLSQRLMGVEVTKWPGVRI